MDGYMELFLETGNPAFYMMAKQENPAARGAADHLDNLRAEEAASPR